MQDFDKIKIKKIIYKVLNFWLGFAPWWLCRCDVIQRDSMASDSLQLCNGAASGAASGDASTTACDPPAEASSEVALEDTREGARRHPPGSG